MTVNTQLVQQIIAWLETRDPNEGYNFLSTEDCAAARYLKDTGQWNGSYAHFYLTNKLGGPEPESGRSYYSHIFGGNTEDRGRTMGACLQRARTLLPA